MGLFDFIFGPKSPIYTRFLLVGKSNEFVLWQKDMWMMISPLLDSLFRDIEGPVIVKGDMLSSGEKRTSASHTKRWNPSKSPKWIFEDKQVENPEFVTIQIEAPSADYCQKHRVWQDIYIEISKPYSEHYNQALHIAVSPQFESRQEITDLLDLINNKISPILKAKTQSSWSDKATESKTIDAFLSIGFNYRGAHLDPIPDLSKIDGDWESF